MYEGLRDVGLEQVRAGMAWWFREYLRASHARAARLSGRGGEREGCEARTVEGAERGTAVGVATQTKVNGRRACQA